MAKFTAKSDHEIRNSKLNFLIETSSMYPLWKGEYDKLLHDLSMHVFLEDIEICYRKGLDKPLCIVTGDDLQLLKIRKGLPFFEYIKKLAQNKVKFSNQVLGVVSSVNKEDLLSKIFTFEQSFGGVGWLKRYKDMRFLTFLVRLKNFGSESERVSTLQRLRVWAAEWLSAISYVPLIVNGVWDTQSVNRLVDVPPPQSFGSKGHFTHAKRIRLNIKESLIQSCYPRNIDLLYETYYDKVHYVAKKEWTSNVAEVAYPFPEMGHTQQHPQLRKSLNGLLLFSLFHSSIQLRTKGRVSPGDKSLYPWSHCEEGRTKDLDKYFARFLIFTLHKRFQNKLANLPGLDKFTPTEQILKNTYKNYRMTQEYFEYVNRYVVSFEEFWDNAKLFEESANYFESTFGVSNSILFL
jgi:hypothetical protein